MLKTVFPTHFRSRCWKKGCQYPQHKDNIACYIEVGGATKIMGVYTTFSGIFFSFVMGGGRALKSLMTVLVNTV